jgi:outer membrane protein OmpA-like peptidoglycan-associated protein
MKVKGFIFSIFVCMGQLLFGQNLVENGSFEIITKKPKNPGEITLAPPWVPGTKAAPDLYSSSAKNDQIKVPVNAYGDEEPKDGNNYAGLLIYSDREKEPRSYLTAKLKNPMLAGEYYCVKFHISFADLSKYASNNIGALITTDSVGSESDLVLKYTPQIINSTNRIFEKQWSWEDICRIYIADGGEQYLTIGNFAPQSDVLTQSVKRPPGYTSTQMRDGYYFIDDISVLPNATPENCKCEPGKFAFANLNKEATEFATDESDIPDKVFISTTGEIQGKSSDNPGIHSDVIIQFTSGKSDLSDAEKAKLDEVAAFLTENGYVKISLISHIDDSEKANASVSGSRLSQVTKYLQSTGVEAEKIESADAGTKRPLDTSGVAANRSKNMVVEISFFK